MSWSKEWPTEPGWYWAYGWTSWCSYEDGGHPELMAVKCDFRGGLKRGDTHMWPPDSDLGGPKGIYRCGPVRWLPMAGVPTEMPPLPETP